MSTFFTFINWTDQGIRDIKDSPHRAEAATALLKDLGGTVKEMYLTSGQQDVVLISEAPDGDVMAKFALAVGSQGNVRTNTTRAWSQKEFEKIVSELP